MYDDGHRLRFLDETIALLRGDLTRPHVIECPARARLPMPHQQRYAYGKQERRRQRADGQRKTPGRGEVAPWLPPPPFTGLGSWGVPRASRSAMRASIHASISSAIHPTEFG